MLPSEGRFVDPVIHRNWILFLNHLQKLLDP